MAIVRKTGIRLTNAEYLSLDFFLSVAQSDYKKHPGLSDTVDEIERLRKKIQQMRLKQKK